MFPILTVCIEFEPLFRLLTQVTPKKQVYRLTISFWGIFLCAVSDKESHKNMKKKTKSQNYAGNKI